MKRFVAITLALLSVALTPSATALGQDAGGNLVALTIGLKEPSVAPGGPVLIAYSLENRSGRKLKYTFQEHDAQRQPLPYPADLTVRVTDESGRVLTENDLSKDEWWSWYYTWPQVQLVPRKKMERVSLDPGKRVERVVDLMKVLSGLESVGGDLEPGTYRVQFAMPGVRSNEIAVTVGGEPARLRRSSP